MMFLTGPSRRVKACSPRVATTNLSEVARTDAARDCRFSSANSVHQRVLAPFTRETRTSKVISFDVLLYDGVTSLDS